MMTTQLVLIAVALSMDAFTVAVARGIVGRSDWAADCIRTGVVFGISQGVMPVIGFYGGRLLAGGLLWSGGRYFALLVLFLLGLKMIIEGFRSGASPPVGGRYWGGLLAQAFATSIDAMTVGLGLCGVTPHILYPALVIGLVTWLVCSAGYAAGQILGAGSFTHAQTVGGAILIALAFRMMLS